MADREARARDIEEAARHACATAVPQGYDHNCLILDDTLGPSFTTPFPLDVHASPDCIGWCGYTSDPPFGSCGPDPDPWACNELNELALAECNRIAPLHGDDFDWTDCRESYEQGTWLNLVSLAIEGDEWLNDEGLTCDEESGCSVAVRPRPTPGWGWPIVAALCVLRRRSRRCSPADRPAAK